MVIFYDAIPLCCHVFSTNSARTFSFLFPRVQSKYIYVLKKWGKTSAVTAFMLSPALQHTYEISAPKNAHVVQQTFVLGIVQ